MLRFLLFIFFCTVSVRIASQTFNLSGRITSNNDPLPFATIMVKGSTIGTNSNVDGFYSLRLPAGRYEIVYQYIGYSKQTKLIELSADKIIDIDLPPDGIALKEVNVTAGEDPANPIIRNAIKKRKFYLHQIPGYTCNAYIKGLQKIKSMPKNIKGLLHLVRAELSDTNDIKGVIYLSESISKYHFKAPSEEKEVMISSKISGDNRSFSFNKLSDMKLDFYDNLVDMGNLSSRPFVSPINENAFLFYRYYLQGSDSGEGKKIYKIKAVPRRKTDPCFTGMIYIQDSTWRITGLDMMLTSDVKIRFVDTLHIRQLYAPVIRDSVWMPVTLNFEFSFKAFGFKGSGYFNAHVSEYDLNPDFSENFFKNEVLVVQEGSNKKDSLYWSQNRAVPLTEEEITDYRSKDSIAKVRDSDIYKDSVDKVSNRLKLRDIFLGYRYTKTKKQFNLSLPGIITNGIQYNTVEGLNLSYKFSADKKFDDFTEYNISGKVRYGFSNKLWGAELGYNYLLNPMKRTMVGMNIKSIAEQFNQQEPILPLINSIYSLFVNENLMKLFKETGAEGYHTTELLNGMYATTTVRYMQRDPLKNTSDILFVDDKNKLFTSNDPTNANSDSSFKSSRAFTAELSLAFRFKQKYSTLPRQKIIIGSKYPRLTISYKKAFPVLNATTDYDLASINISDAVKLGIFGRFSYRLRGGAFLRFKEMHFMDFKHFLGNQTLVNTNDYLGSFRLLPYYKYSADRWFTEVHAEHHFLGLILGRIPLLKESPIQEVAGFHFLSNNKLDYYYELNFGLENILRIVRIDYVLAYSPEQKLKQGFTIGLSIRF